MPAALWGPWLTEHTHTLPVRLWNLSLRLPIVIVSDCPNVLTGRPRLQVLQPCSWSSICPHVNRIQKTSVVSQLIIAAVWNMLTFIDLAFVTDIQLLCSQNVPPPLCTKWHFPLPFWKTAGNGVKFSTGATSQISIGSEHELWARES